MEMAESRPEQGNLRDDNSSVAYVDCIVLSATVSGPARVRSGHLPQYLMYLPAGDTA